MSRRWSPSLGRAGAAAGSHPPHLEAWTWGEGCRVTPFVPLTGTSLQALWGWRPSQSHPGTGCPGPGLAHREPGHMCAYIPPPPRLPTIPAIWCSFRRAPRWSWWPPSPASGRVAPQHGLGTRGLGQQVDMKDGRPMRRDVKLPYSLPSPSLPR